MTNTVPKIVAINDISGCGRCSMTVILPILSALGCQVCPLPTAILSNHSEYKNFYFYDFTKHMDEYYKNWELNNIEIDCIYSGFLGSAKQIDIIINIINKSKTRNTPLIIVDPVMGDHGVIYQTYNDKMVEKMTQLVKNADIVTPNLTETCALLHENYSSDPLKTNNIKNYLKNISEIGPKKVIITGLKTEDGEFINAFYDKETDAYWKIPYDNIDTRYPGTGDLFTSLFIGYLYNDMNFPDAISTAARFVTLAVSETSKAGTNKCDGVLFEKIMKDLFTYENKLNNMYFRM